jgi:hypothetical protein
VKNNIQDVKSRLNMNREDLIVDDLFNMSKYVIKIMKMTKVSSLEFILLSDMCYQINAIKTNGEEVKLDFDKYIDDENIELNKAKTEIQSLLCESDFAKIKNNLLERSLNEL